MTPEERKARAMQKVAAYRERIAEGSAEPREEFFARHEDLRDLLEGMLDESQAVTASIPPAQSPTTLLPDALQQEILAVHAGPTDVSAKKIEELCRRHAQHAEDIRGFIQSLERTEDRVMAAARKTSSVPAQIGPYRILRVLGEGGMGTVYVAEQTEPVRRKVALKVIKLGMDSAMVLRRFEAERQALAMMEHSNIARVYDAGTTEQGQPFFAMEYVQGTPITRYCDEHKLRLEDRLDLFRQLCSGVQHAHHKGVIHRDLKPSNVLVSDQDGEPTAKIIDFGVARATDHRLVEATIFTEQGLMIGTPEYMSPEQAGVDELDIDTRTDVYSLGVLLYELLVGALPFSGEELRSAGLGEMERKIREDDPPKPSTRLSGPGTEALAGLRRTDLKSLNRKLKGDLDWIVMKAMEKDRSRRYQTAIGLAEDLERHLADEPVRASPPSLRYRAGKFARRYRSQVIAAGAVFVTLLAGIVGTTFFKIRADADSESASLLASGARLSLARVALEELDDHPAWPAYIGGMQAWIDDHGAPLENLEPLNQAIEALGDRRIPSPGGETGEPVFADKEEELRHATLVTLRTGLEAFLNPDRGDLARVRDRLEWAKTVEGSSITAYLERWRKAREAILKADDVVAHYAYAFPSIDLQPQLGLVPIGMNPVTLFWEFYHLRSAEDPSVIPEHEPDGNIEVTPETGIIFVLLPGVEGPFFLARHEMTQGQWKRLSFGDEPSYYYAGYIQEGVREPVTAVHPVEMVTWDMCDELLTQHGLRFPTDAEWVYAYRAGTSTRFFTGSDDPKSLFGYVNIMDESGNGTYLPDRSRTYQEGYDDGWALHSPVGSLKPNPWGFFDIAGNVYEHGQDYSVEPPYRTNRGGHFAWVGGTGGRGGPNDWPASSTNYPFGLRPARALFHERP